MNKNKTKTAAKELIINAQNLPLGRLAAFAAKKALLGYKIQVANCAKALISGTKKDVLKDYLQRRARGTPTTGPFFPRSSDGIVKRAIRGMLPYKKGHGNEAFRRISCRTGPIDGMKTIEVKKGKLQKYIAVEEISKLL